MKNVFKMLTASAVLAMMLGLAGCAAPNNDAAQNATSTPSSSAVAATTEKAAANTTTTPAPAPTPAPPAAASARAPNPNTSQAAPAAAPAPAPAPEHAQPDQATVQIISYKNPAPRNSNQTVVAQVPPHTNAHIEVEYKSGPSQAHGLEDKTSGDNGKVSWTWKVGGNTTIGYPVTVIVSAQGQSDRTTFQVVH